MPSSTSAAYINTETSFGPASGKLFASSAAKEQGLLVYPCAGIIDGRSGDSIMLLPPLTITTSEIGQLVDRLDAAIATVSASLTGAG